jgi:hypothetical protein
MTAPANIMIISNAFERISAHEYFFILKAQYPF